MDTPALSLFARCYSAYGLRVRTSIPLSVPQISSDSPCDIDVIPGNSVLFEESIRHLNIRVDWAQAHRLPERWLYARFEGLFDFLVNPNGSRILYRPLGEFTPASFETYLLGMLMKAVLIKRGDQSLHGSAVIVDGKAVAFLGSNGYGKSSLAACFVSAGYPLLSDDVLRLENVDGVMWAHPGPACLKLLPEDAHRWFNGSLVGVPMDPDADKWLFPLTGELRCQKRVPLRSVYSVVGPQKTGAVEDVVIRPLEQREAVKEILEATHIDPVVERDRLTHLFVLAKRLAGTLPTRLLTYPRKMRLLPDVREAILKDVRGL